MLKYLFKNIFILLFFFLIVISIPIIEADSFPQNHKPNLVADLIGARILNDENIEFKKIITASSHNIVYCDNDFNLYKYNRYSNKHGLSEISSKKCKPVVTSSGIVDDNGIGPLFSSLYTLLKEQNNASTNNTKRTVANEASTDIRSN